MLPSSSSYMAVVMDQQQTFKHYCKICKKGFVCGRALGGHMRAHGIGDEVGHPDDEDDPASDWEDKLGGGDPLGGSKRMYALRTNPNRFKSCRSCENCGKEFLSWKSFLEHGKCSEDDDAEESLVSEPAGSDGDDGGGWRGWSKGKRSRRVVKLGNLNSPNCCPSSEEEDLAHCLVMLSTSRVDPLVAETEESCASASKEEERPWNPPTSIHHHQIAASVSQAPPEKAKTTAARGGFECKACKKVFNSHQALGGHRASHKKVKGCFAAKLDEAEMMESNVEEDVITHDDFLSPAKTAAFERAPHLDPSKRKSKVHECSICHRIFASGQALGGHKRCHWVTSNPPDASITKLHQLQDHHNERQLHQRPKLSKAEPLDLNLPAPADDNGGARRENGNPLNLEVPMALYLKQWIGMNPGGNENKRIKSLGNNNDESKSIVPTSMLHVDDEADSKIKLAKLSDLKDMNMTHGPSQWLQVGIGSAADGGTDP